MNELESKDQIDILDRTGFIDNVMTIIKNCKTQKEETSFSINGNWGYGKSFILDRLQDKLSEDKANYIVLRYDSWKYDYYEEPLVALISNIADQLLGENGATTTLADKAKKAAGRVAFEFAVAFAGPLALALRVGEKALKSYQESEKDSHKYDNYSTLKKSLKIIQELIVEIAEEKQLVLMIDELDRCLPAYQIKVLERIHHVIVGTNTMVIYALNPKQLSETIRQIYGGDEDRVTAYLKKFLHFSLTLDAGKVSDEFKKKYKNDIDLFDPDNTQGPVNDDIYFHKVSTQLFSELDVRTQEKLWGKRRIIHNIVFHDGDSKLPIIYLTCELFLLAMGEWKKHCLPNDWNSLNWNTGTPIAALIGAGFKGNKDQNGNKVLPISLEVNTFWKELLESFNSAQLRVLGRSSPDAKKVFYAEPSNINDLIRLIAVWSYINECHLEIRWKSESSEISIEEELFNKLRESMKQFNELIKIMA